MFFQKKTAVAAVVAHIFNPSDGILSTSPDTKPKIEFLQSSEELREIHFGSRNNLVEIEKGLASNPHCNVFGAGAVGRLENPGDQRLIQGLLKEKLLLLFLPKSGGCNRLASNPPMFLKPEP